ncbi:hypothetical protein AB0F18_32870, partial [Streptomyces sp. NPDC029216]|uniref:hypothetical protein n=1 Tax=Streptomyces sp. NPDC029216 TaxID=3154701 RepID=UPI0034026EC5
MAYSIALPAFAAASSAAAAAFSAWSAALLAASRATPAAAEARFARVCESGRDGNAGYVPQNELPWELNP